MQYPNEKQPAPSHLAIARIVAAHGLLGEVRAQILTDFPDRFSALRTVWVGRPPHSFDVVRSRLHRGQVILRLAGIDSREQAEALLNAEVSVLIDEAVHLSEGQYYWHQIIGLAVLTSSGDLLGRVAEIITTGANDVYVVISPEGRELLIPAIEDVVKSVDLDAGRLIVEPVPGLLD